MFTQQNWTKNLLAIKLFSHSGAASKPERNTELEIIGVDFNVLNYLEMYEYIQQR